MPPNMTLNVVDASKKLSLSHENFYPQSLLALLSKSENFLLEVASLYGCGLVALLLTIARNSLCLRMVACSKNICLLMK